MLARLSASSLGVYACPVCVERHGPAGNLPSRFDPHPVPTFIDASWSRLRKTSCIYRTFDVFHPVISSVLRLMQFENIFSIFTMLDVSHCEASTALRFAHM